MDIIKKKYPFLDDNDQSTIYSPIVDIEKVIANSSSTLGVNF